MKFSTSSAKLLSLALCFAGSSWAGGYRSSSTSLSFTTFPFSSTTSYSTTSYHNSTTTTSTTLSTSKIHSSSTSTTLSTTTSSPKARSSSTFSHRTTSLSTFSHHTRSSSTTSPHRTASSSTSSHHTRSSSTTSSHKTKPATTTSHKTRSTSSSHTTTFPHRFSTTTHNTSKPTTSSTSTLKTLNHSLASEVVHPSYIPQHPWGPSFIPSGHNNLPQDKTNGKSHLGTFGAPQFPPWIGHGSGAPTPWGNRNASHTNPYKNPPTTGVTRYYNFDITYQTIAPDGVARPVILVNGQFPGPTIEADWGDMISVTVSNSLNDEGTAIHWHGLLQTGTPYMDGIPGITQCPIAPGQTFTYEFKADLYGSSWYHSHYSAQYAAGMYGAMVIHGPTNAPYDTDLGPVLLADYYHASYLDIVKQVMGTDLTKVAPLSVNNLINGKGVYNCSLVADSSTCTPDAGLSHFAFESGKTHRLRLVNAGAEGIQKFSIDEHTLTVIAYDFVPIEPYNTTVVTLGIGQRADILVTANLSSTSSVWMRSEISSCSLTTQPNGLAMIYYEAADTSAKPTSSAWVDNSNPCADDDLSLITPYFALTPPSPATTETIAINFGVNATGHLLWTMNDSSFRVNYNDPILQLANEGNTSYPYDPEWNVYNFGSNSSIRIVIENLTPVAHPMHLHGHNMYVLAEGTGSTWDGTITNPTNPTRRDVQLVQPNGHIVIQIDADNPGVWPFHCHIAWHVSGGLYVNILERPNDIAKLSIPEPVTNLCNSWSKWQSSNAVDEIDSGLKM